jgi:hypothetical protein
VEEGIFPLVVRVKLSERQQQFAHDLGKLLVWIYADPAQRPWRVSMGDVWAHDGHMLGSCHYVRLAADLNLFVDGTYITGAHPAWYAIGDYWKSLSPDNRWGGDFQSGDYNHVSVEWQGRA